MSDHDEVRRRLDLLSDEELATIVREKDVEQWRPEVFDFAASILESRGISLRDVLAQGSGEDEDEEQEDPADARGMVTIARYTDLLLAHSDRLALKQAGIRAWVVGDDYATREGAGAPSLRIRKEDVDAALEILDAPPSSTSDLPAEFADITCPRCGSPEIEEVDEVVDVVDASSCSGPRSKREVYFYRCATCRHNWSA